MSCTVCALGGHISSDTTACEGCGQPFCDDCMVRDDAGAWCLDCNDANLRESVGCEPVEVVS